MSHRRRPHPCTGPPGACAFSAGVLVLVLATLPTFPLEVHAGTIEGRVLTRSPRPANSGKAASTVAPVALRGITEAVVYVDKISEKAERSLIRRRWWQRKPKPKVPRIVQADLRFTPRVLVAPVGTRVEFTNLDRVFHNAFSVSAARRFDLGRYPPGHVDTVAFDRAGVANLHCDIHPRETGFVVVVPNHAFARPDSLGRYRLPKLPAGSYRVRVWHPRLGEISRKVTMPKRGDVALDLSYRS